MRLNQPTAMNTPTRVRAKPYLPPTVIISSEDFTKNQRFHYENIEDTNHIDPSEQFDRDVEALAEIYGCTEAEITRAILRNL